MNRLKLFVFLFFIATNLFSQKNGLENKNVVLSENQNFLVTQYSVSDGLSDNSVTDILQDQNGYIWVATRYGLNRFDGYTFTIFKYQPGNRTSLSNNKINDLFEDNSGRLWIATEGGLNLFDPTTETFTHFKHDPNDKNSISHNRIKAIFEDSQGILWLGTRNGLNKFNKEKKSFQLYQHQATHHRYFEKEPNHEISKIIEDDDSFLIVGYWGMGLMLFDKKKETFTQIPVNGKLDTYALNLTTDALEKGKNGKIWVIAGGKLFEYQKNKELINLYSNDVSACKNLSVFIPTNSGQYVTGSNKKGNGFHLLDQNFQIRDYFNPSTYDSLSNMNQVFSAILEDKAGDIWAGARGRGIYHFNTKGSSFSNYQDSLNQTSDPNNYVIRSLIELDEDKILIAKNDGRTKVFNKKNKTFESAPTLIQHPHSNTSTPINCMYKDRGENIWFGIWNFGIELYNSSTQTFQHFQSIYRNETTLSDRFISQILETKENEIWVTTYRGLSVLSNQKNIQEGKFKRYKHIIDDTSSLNHPNPNVIYQRLNGQIWIGSPDGLHLYNRTNDNFILYTHDIEDSKSINSNNILSIFEDQNQQLWIGTGSGLNKYNDQDNSFQQIKGQENLLDSHIYSIREDGKNRLWLGSKKGLILYNPNTEHTRIFSAKDGLLNARFDRKAFIISEETGNIYIGNGNRISVFHPDSIKSNSFVPPVHISSLKTYIEKDKETIETKIGGISKRKEITFAYKENILTFELVALNFRNPTENQYAYKLEGFNENWIDIGTKREITFTNLNPGNYTLQVKGSNNDGIWNEKITALNIKILPPWWKTTLAYSIYGLFFLGILYIIYRTLLRRQELQYQLQSEKLEAARLKELDSFKSRLTTNLTHEFRTPLTVILGMTAQIRNEPKKYLKEGTQLIEANGKNLLRLINQLLDLSKLENKSFQLKLQQDDIIPYLAYITESFQSFANGKNLVLKFSSTLPTLVMDFDPEQIKQIMTNLISNAVKFTPSSGSIKVVVSSKNNHLEIEVRDTGIGIPEKELPHIFERFYQVDGSMTRNDEGTGIGLAHTKELVRLMQGDISIKSVLGNGTSFFINIPIYNNTPIRKNPLEKESSLDIPMTNKIELKTESSPNQTNNKELPQLLIIEDNPDVVIYLKSCLDDIYQLEVALNGKIGIEKALQNIPDLIISDVMMPEKNGYEVCDKLKNDERTSHIPIILLTAKADLDSKIAGLKRGADAYLSKPFDKEELLIRLERMVEKQKNLSAYFSKKFQNGEAPSTINHPPSTDIQIEDVFIQKVRKVVEENYSDEHFALPNLCQKIGMSRSQLFRKMKALINESPSAFIRNYRLNKGRELLENSDLNVSEVAWEVGFKDVAHFSKSYLEKFKISPSTTIK